MDPTPGAGESTWKRRPLAGRYQLLEQLGQGARGSVWRALDRAEAREVALKLLRPGEATPHALLRFEREGRLAAELRSPHVARVELAGVDGELRFLVQELVPGETLQALVRRAGPLSPRRAAELGLALARGLMAVHAAGILHRDVKPANVVTGPAGTKLVDFGVARRVDEDGSGRLTRSGAMIGTPAYMAPETLAGQEASSASEAWSLGAVLHFLLAGAPPQAELQDDPTALAAARLHAPPSAPAAGLPPLLARLLERLLAPDPGERPGLVEAAGVLQALLGSSGPRQGARPPVAALALVLLAAASAGWAWLAAPGPAPAPSGALAATTSSAPPAAPAWSRLLFRLDLAGLGLPDGATLPRTPGEGPLAGEGRLEVSFYPRYLPVLWRHPDGGAGARFPRRSEQATAEGRDYSMFGAQVMLGGAFLREPALRVEFVVRLPRLYDHSAPSYYHDHRGLVSLRTSQPGVQRVTCQFLADDRLGVLIEGELRGEVRLPAPPPGGVPLLVSLELEPVPAGAVRLTFDGHTHPQAVRLPVDLRLGEEELYLSAGGNALCSDEELDYFSSLDRVEVRAR